MTFVTAAKWFKPVVGLSLVLGAALARAEKWQRIKLYDGGNGEAATYGDFNHDGKLDVAAGMWWWEGPAFTVKHAFGTRSGTALYGYDFNGDGWTDLLLYSAQGGEGYLYINRYLDFDQGIRAYGWRKPRFLRRHRRWKTRSLCVREP
jgi:hypothetical protein